MFTVPSATYTNIHAGPRRRGEGRQDPERRDHHAAAEAGRYAGARRLRYRRPIWYVILYVGGALRQILHLMHRASLICFQTE